MTKSAHGHFSIAWCDQVCLVRLSGSFNREGVVALTAAVIQRWEEAGRPQVWAHVMDLRQWEGGTPDSFAAARELVAWTVSHGAAAIARLQSSNFLSRITDRQGVLDEAGVPIVDLSTPEETWRWLRSRGLLCEACQALLA